MKGAAYIAEFLAQRGMDQVFLLTGGAATFLVDALALNPKVDYRCVQHEQAAAMAGDAVWRVSGNVGAVMATSGPGATNLITGICCNWFDSIPCLYITGQVNLKHAEVFEGTKVRQFGFQETDIVTLVSSVTKYSRQVTTPDQLRESLVEAYNACITGRMGPALIDVPMDLQQTEVGDEILYYPPTKEASAANSLDKEIHAIDALLSNAERPLVLFGAGLGLAGVEAEVESWLREKQIPVVASWSGSCYLRQDFPGYLGCIGVYGNRGANYALQNCDALLVLGSRLDTRQRPGDPRDFAPAATIHVVDIDEEEIKKYEKNGYGSSILDLRRIGEVLGALAPIKLSSTWTDYMAEMRERFYGKDVSKFANKMGSISPYAIIQKLNNLVDDDATIVIDCGATTCWFFQMFHRTTQTVFSNGGCAPISYAIGASIGAATSRPDKQTIVIIGDGGFQNNIQELQTVVQYDLNIKFIILNNYGYGIVKQFQDLYMEGRHEATGRGYGVPDLAKIADGYGVGYVRVDELDEFTSEAIQKPGAAIIDVTLHPNTLIEPKLELGRPINDQYPYVSDADFAEANRFVRFERPEWLSERIVLE
ncbi:MAG: thiamine pyrophosphate-binding protein [Rhodospirillaceae bacterium]|nr:thiamine pyrophosphate-binding protein [Rhodospirillaceae bacterium]